MVDGRVVGLVQVLVREMLAFFQSIRIHRGPLWLGEEPSPSLQRAVFTALRREFPQGIVRKVSLMPEMEENADNEKMMMQSGFTKTGKGYETIWLDLNRTTEELRTRLSANWRNHLKQAERSPLTVDITSDGRECLPWLASLCAADQKARCYRGPSVPLVIRLRNVFYKKGGVLLLRAMLPPEDGSYEASPVAGILVLRHKNTATWLIGWSGSLGRRYHAHTLLLWNAIIHLQTLGTRWFDLGGINSEHAPGITAFKRGLGGEEVALVGSFL